MPEERFMSSPSFDFHVGLHARLRKAATSLAPQFHAGHHLFLYAELRSNLIDMARAPM
jgi:hypothetical protein